jgi:hypothetical protein
MPRPLTSYRVPSILVATLVLGVTAALQAPGLGLLAVPFLVAAALAGRRPRTGAVVALPFTLLVLAISVNQLLVAGPEGPEDVVFDVFGLPLGALVLLGCVSVFRTRGTVAAR